MTPVTAINDCHLTVAGRLAAARILAATHPVDQQADCEVDLHSHTFCSDGFHSPAGRVFEAYRRGMKGVGIVDHDVFDGCLESMAAAEIFPVAVIPGIEFYTDRPGIEILGFFPDHAHLRRLLASGATRDLIERIRTAKQTQLQMMIARVPECFAELGLAGAEITPDDIDQVVRNGITTKGDISVILEAKYGDKLRELNLSQNVKELHAQFTSRRDRLEVPLVLDADISPECLTRQIFDWGGVPVLAHPTELRTKEHLDNQALIDTVRRLRRYGLQGIEADGFRNQICPESNIRQTDLFESIRLQLNREEPELLPLLATNGGDTHNQPGEQGLELGCGLHHNLRPEFGRFAVIEALAARQRQIIGGQ